MTPKELNAFNLENNSLIPNKTKILGIPIQNLELEKIENSQNSRFPHSKDIKEEKENLKINKIPNKT